MTQDIRVIQYGPGPIGAAVARQLVERQGVELVGGVVGIQESARQKTTEGDVQ